MKNGAPAAAVMMPIDSSTGACRVRAAMSAVIRNTPPSSAAASRTRR